MTLNNSNLAVILLLILFAPANAQPLIEPRLTINSGQHHGPRVRLTMDACTGAADERILQALIANNIKATIFVTARWLKRNPMAIAEIKSHPDLFQIENHGARHVPAVDFPMRVFGLASAGSPEAVRTEVELGSVAITANFGTKPKWFRGATGKYTKSSIAEIEAMGFHIAGYSILGDGGAEFSANRTAETIAQAHDGDVIIAHVNQPKKSAGLGVVEGVLRLKAAGFVFLTLD
jgi:peptidoglycan/xylan/chitin deacetylase (PgdA/CDA1 family)